MEMNDINALLEKYYKWLKDETVVKKIDSEWYKITTPSVDRHNDLIEIYIKKQLNEIILTDDGYTINDLIDSGCDLKTPKRKKILEQTLLGFGVKIEDNELLMHAKESNFSLKKHNFIQAILAINDLFYLAAPVVQSLFYEDVQNWLDNENIRYTPDIKFTGKSGYDHRFDFVIPKSKLHPERVIQTVNNPSKQNAESIIFKWQDAQLVRSEKSRLYAMINDKEENVSSGIKDALLSYSIEPLLWTKRESKLPELKD